MVGEQFTEIFTKRQENIELLINLLDEFDFKVRYPTIKLLTNLLKNRCVKLGVFCDVTEGMYLSIYLSI